MKGKKTDNRFLSQFISQCISKGLTEPQQIANEAKSLITDIDQKIMEVIDLKITRSKLLDVISAFEKSVKNKSEEVKLLPFFRLQYPQICKELCDKIRNNNTLLLSYLDTPEAIFCVKQLIEVKIITRIDSYLVHGERFDEYMAFVWQETS